MTAPMVRWEQDRGEIAFLVLDRPEKRNALSVPLLEDLDRSLARAERERPRVIILRGAGAAFCTGLDLKEASDPSRAEASARLVRAALDRLAHFPGVTIAAVHGAAVAGGAGLMSACDLVVAASDTRIGYPEVHRGLVAGLVMTFLRRQLHERDIKELLLLGELVDAERARAMGLVNRVVAPEDLLSEARRLAEQSLRAGPLAIERTKALLEQLWPRIYEQDFELAHATHLEARASGEFQEGLAAFLEKRAPAWAPRDNPGTR